MCDGFEPIDDDEVVYRRALPYWYQDGVLADATFRPTERDTDGLSLWRARHVSVEEAARGRGPEYYVAAVSVRDIRALGIEIVPDAPSGVRGHCIVPALNFDDRKSTRSLECQRALARRAEVSGPFRSTPSTDSNA
jgi:hypothetical protein